MNSLTNLSPIDGRYYEKTKELENYFSEYALIKYRVTVEIKWLIYMLLHHIIEEAYTQDEIERMEEIIQSFNLEEAEKVKEKEMVTKHDVKAVEYYLQDKFQELHLEHFIPFIHFTLTSEDVNNVSYNLMLKDGLEHVYLPKLEEFILELDKVSLEYKNIPMLGHTHGQAATPTTVGKEFKVYSYRLKSVLQFIKNLKLRSKFSGAVGNYNAHMVVNPTIDWIEESSLFIESLGLEYNPVTTQIESHDILCILLSYLKILNNIIKDFNSDMWLYISRGYFHEKMKIGEVGSSVMPHKVNPINHENSMANVELSNGLINALVDHLSISRMQRDLSDSSKLRNLGVILGHSYVSFTESLTGLRKIEVNQELLVQELKEHYEVLSEAIQMVLRKNRIVDAYEQLKALSRGKTLTKDDIVAFVAGLDILEEDKERLLELTPESYVGLSEEIVTRN